MEYTVNTFNLGSSVVSVWPKKLNIPANVSVKIKVSGGFVTAIAKPKSQTQIAKNIAIIHKLAGGNKSKFTLTPDEMNRAYDLGTYGK